jgi:hydantoinase/carbamoylase family amidase
VIAALEILQTLKEQGQPLPYHLEAVAFTDEEGRFGDFFGSKALAGRHTPQSISSFLASAAAYPDDLTAIQEELPGPLTAQTISSARRSPESLCCFLELHIEQGPQLEHHRTAIGVVDAIFGRRTFQLDFHGRADHAGTTPLHYRADALVAAAQLVVEMRDYVGHAHPQAVITCGDIRVKPGVFNVVPEQSSLLVEFRAADDTVLEDIQQTMIQFAERCTRSPGLSFTVKPVHRQTPVSLDKNIQSQLREAADKLEYNWSQLSSGAGHDAQIMAAIAPTGLIFVPSHNGKSHTPAEYTAPDDLVAGADVLLHTVLNLLTA